MRKYVLACLVAGTLIGSAQLGGAQPPDRVVGGNRADTPAEPVFAPITLQELTGLMGAPTRLTVHWRAVSPQAAFDDLAKQAAQHGIELRRRGGGAKTGLPITVDVQNQPFWVAMQTLAPKLHLFPMPWGRGTGIDLGPEDNGAGKLLQGLASQRGPVLVLANEVEHSQLATQVPGQKLPSAKRRTLALTLTVFVDPKLRVLANRAQLKLTQVVDDKAQPLTLDDIGGLDNAPPLSAGRPFTLRVALNQPANVGTRMTHFKAILSLPVVARQDVWNVPIIVAAKNVTKAIGTDQYTVESVAKTDNGYEVRLTATRPRPDLAFNFSLFNAVRLVDAQGREYLRRGNEARREGNRITARIPFLRPNNNINNFVNVTPGQVGEPARLVWEIPRDIRMVDVPLDFTDLPIP